MSSAYEAAGETVFLTRHGDPRRAQQWAMLALTAYFTRTLDD